MNRYDFVYLFDVKDANPNGDPDAGNLPRIDPETGDGLVTDVCLKRKIRNYVLLTKKDQPRFNIFIQEKKPLNPLIAGACKANNLPDYSKSTGKWDTDQAKKRSSAEITTLQNWLCDQYYDIRTFGAVMSTGPNAGQLRGPAQLSFARSVQPIVSLEHAITRVTDVDKEEGEMGRKYTVPYALYQAYGFVNPFLADKTGFNEADLDLLWESLLNTFQFDSSSARPPGSMVARKLIVFEHVNSQLGNAQSHDLFDRVKVELPEDKNKPVRNFSEYKVLLDGQPITETKKVVPVAANS
jgi:CRISPR-associated protein Csd2